MGTRIKTYFISDPHFGHPSILRFHPKRRELAGITLEELENDKKTAIKKHDEWLINIWNSTVQKNDVVYILGDVCLDDKEYTESILKRLKGKKFLITGNHDKSCKGLENYFEWVGNIKEVKFTHNQYDFIDKDETFALELCHFPFFSWNRRPHGACHAHGHCHGSIDWVNKKTKELRIDIGFDGELANYQLLPLDTLYYAFKDIVHRNTKVTNFFRRIFKKPKIKTFQEYIDWKMLKDHYRA